MLIASVVHDWNDVLGVCFYFSFVVVYNKDVVYAASLQKNGKVFLVSLVRQHPHIILAQQMIEIGLLVLVLQKIADTLQVVPAPSCEQY